MEHLLTRMDPALLIPITAIVMGCLVGIVVSVSNSWSKVRRAEMEMALKQDMLNRGMSAGEITQVLQASAQKSDAETCAKG